MHNLGGKALQQRGKHDWVVKRLCSFCEEYYEGG